jgi:hypothetical protein
VKRKRLALSFTPRLLYPEEATLLITTGKEIRWNTGSV